MSSDTSAIDKAEVERVDTGEGRGVDSGRWTVEATELTCALMSSGVECRKALVSFPASAPSCGRCTECLHVGQHAPLTMMQGQQAPVNARAEWVAGEARSPPDLVMTRRYWSPFQSPPTALSVASAADFLRRCSALHGLGSGRRRKERKREETTAVPTIHALIPTRLGASSSQRTHRDTVLKLRERVDASVFSLVLYFHVHRLRIDGAGVRQKSGSSSPSTHPPRKSQRCAIVRSRSHGARGWPGGRGEAEGRERPMVPRWEQLGAVGASDAHPLICVSVCTGATGPMRNASGALAPPTRPHHSRALTPTLAPPRQQ